MTQADEFLTMAERMQERSEMAHRKALEYEDGDPRQIRYLIQLCYSNYQLIVAIYDRLRRMEHRL